MKTPDEKVPKLFRFLLLVHVTKKHRYNVTERWRKSQVVTKVIGPNLVTIHQVDVESFRGITESIHLLLMLQEKSGDH